MANKTDVLELEVKSNIKEVNKETTDLVNNFGAFGITIGGVKEKFVEMGKIMLNGLKAIKLQAQLAGVGFKQMFSGQVIRGAKTLFKVIKTGIAATGIGLLVVAFGSLVSYVTQTKTGAEALEKVLTTLGASVSVVTDRIAKFGGGVVKFFKGDFKGAAKDVKESVKGIVTEIKEEVKATDAMVTATQKLRDAQRELNVETAQSVADIEKLKLVAEDITKTYEEREKAAVSAFAKEKELEDKRIVLAEEAVAQELERHRMMGKDGVMAEDLDALAELEINLANIKQEAAGRQISLQNFLNGLREQEKTEIQADKDKKKADDDAEWDAKIKANDDWNKEQQKNRDDAKAADKKLKDDKKKLEEDLQAFKMNMVNQGLNFIQQAAGEGTELAKAAAVAQATISGVQGVQAAFTAANANVALTAATAGAYPIAMATAAGVFSAMNIQKILSGGGADSAGSVPSVSSASPSPQMMSGSFEMPNLQGNKPIQAFVVSDQITDSQDGLAIIRRRATI